MKGLTIFVFSLFFFSCTNRDSVPSGVISPDSMQVILKDVILADQFSTQFVLKDSLLKDSSLRNVKAETLRLYETIFKLHKVSKDEFRKSMDFYYSRPDLIKKIFDSLATYENRHRNELYAPKPTIAPIKKDSLGSHSADSLKLHIRDSLKSRFKVPVK